MGSPERASVDWSALSDAYGPATDITKQLERILSPNPGVRERGWGELYDRVLHQGSVYTATAGVARIVGRHVRHGTAPAPGEFLTFLEATLSNVDRDGWSITLCSGGPAIVEIRSWVDDESEWFADLLENKDQQSRRVALLALGNVSDTLFAAQHLLIHWERETDPFLRAFTVLQLRGAARQMPGWQGRLERALEKETEPVVLLVLAFALAETAGPAAGLDTEIVLQKGLVALRNDSSDEDTSPELEWHGKPWLDLFLDGSSFLGEQRFVASVCSTIPLLADSNEALQVASRALRTVFQDTRKWEGTSYSIDSSGGTRGRAVLSSLSQILWFGIRALGRLFGMESPESGSVNGTRRIDFWGLQGQMPHIPQELTQSQRRVLSAIAGADALWTVRTNLWQLFRLPEDREDLSEAADTGRLA